SVTIDVTDPSSSVVAAAMDPDHDGHLCPHGPRRYPHIQEQAIFLTDPRRVPVEPGPRLRARCAEGRRVAHSLPRPVWHRFGPRKRASGGLCEPIPFEAGPPFLGAAPKDPPAGHRNDEPGHVIWYLRRSDRRLERERDIKCSAERNDDRKKNLHCISECP